MDTLISLIIGSILMISLGVIHIYCRLCAIKYGGFSNWLLVLMGIIIFIGFALFGVPNK